MHGVVLLLITNILNTVFLQSNCLIDIYRYINSLFLLATRAITTNVTSNRQYLENCLTGRRHVICHVCMLKLSMPFTANQIILASLRRYFASFPKQVNYVVSDKKFRSQLVKLDTSPLVLLI